MNPDNLGNWARDFATMIQNTTLNTFDGPAHLRDVYALLNDACDVALVSGKERDYLVKKIEQKFNAFGWESSRPKRSIKMFAPFKRLQIEGLYE